MPLPTPTEVREYLEGYGITDLVLSDDWISKRITRSIVPIIERITKTSLTSEISYTEFLSGTGKSTLLLSKRPINSLVSFTYVRNVDIDLIFNIASIEVLSQEGILKIKTSPIESGGIAVFRKGSKNIKVVYKAGFTTLPDDLHEAILLLSCEQLLGFVGARTGGGSLTVQGFSRNFGERGKYQDIRNDLKRQGISLLNSYMTGIVGR